MPNDVQVLRVDESLNSFGNHIACNDHVALINPDLSEEFESKIQEVLKVTTHRVNIAGLQLIGSYCHLTNQGGLVHPQISITEMEKLSQLTNLPLCAGTVNRGSDLIGAGVVANDENAFCGNNCTTNEVTLIDAIFKIGAKEQLFNEEMHA